MSDTDDPFAPPSAEYTAKSARSKTESSVQSSLFMGLKWRYPAGSGKIAWYLIWLTKPDHKRHDEARWALEQRPPEDIQQLRTAVKKAQASKNATPAWADLCRAILGALSDVGKVTVARAEQAKESELALAKTRRDKQVARIHELIASGIGPDDAARQAHAEMQKSGAP